MKGGVTPLRKLTFWIGMTFIAAALSAYWVRLFIDDDKVDAGFAFLHQWAWLLIVIGIICMAVPFSLSYFGKE